MGGLVPQHRWWGAGGGVVAWPASSVDVLVVPVQAEAAAVSGEDVWRDGVWPTAEFVARLVRERAELDEAAIREQLERIPMWKWGLVIIHVYGTTVDMARDAVAERRNDVVIRWPRPVVVVRPFREVGVRHYLSQQVAVMRAQRRARAES